MNTSDKRNGGRTQSARGLLLSGALLATGALIASYWFISQNGETASDSTTGISAQEPEQEAAQGILAQGTVEAVGDAAAMAKQIGTVFVILRDKNQGPPYAVVKLKNTDGLSSLNFSITDSDVMLAGRPAPLEPMLKVRFDSDGDPMTELPTDVVGTLESFEMGSTGLQINADLAVNSASSQTSN